MVLSELPHHQCTYPSSLTLGLGVLFCGTPWEVVTVCHPPILAKRDWLGVGLSTPPHYPSVKHSHTPMELILLVQTGLTCWCQCPHLHTRV